MATLSAAGASERVAAPSAGGGRVLTARQRQCVPGRHAWLGGFTGASPACGCALLRRRWGRAGVRIVQRAAIVCTGHRPAHPDQAVEAQHQIHACARQRRRGMARGGWVGGGRALRCAATARRRWQRRALGRGRDAAWQAAQCRGTHLHARCPTPPSTTLRSPIPSSVTKCCRCRLIRLAGTSTSCPPANFPYLRLRV